MASLLLLANPAASGFTGGLHRDVVTTLRSAYDVEAAWPQSPEDARAHAAAAVVAGIDIVAAFGGDGVVHHVANGLMGSPTALGVIPAGTTNVVARVLGLPHKPMAATEFLATVPAAKRIPVAELQTSAFTGASDKRVAVFAAGAGLDAEVVQIAEQEPYRKYSFGSLHYARTALNVLWNEFRGRAPNMRVAAGDRSADAVAVFVQIHEMYSYFGRLPLRLGGHVAGTLTALVVQELPPQRAFNVLARALTTGGVGGVPGCELWTGVENLS
ncbi:MAG: diacylglycerol kinase family protein, partial [Acidimicrobiia bacterium]|nr:diacylglycerol kinase family protein [Acidimicrobiia bacterium]